MRGVSCRTAVLHGGRVVNWPSLFHVQAVSISISQTLVLHFNHRATNRKIICPDGATFTIAKSIRDIPCDCPFATPQPPPDFTKPSHRYALFNPSYITPSTMLAPPMLKDAPSSSVVCPNCGTVCAAESSRRIAELEAQVRILTDKASAAGTCSLLHAT